MSFFSIKLCCQIFPCSHFVSRLSSHIPPSFYLPNAAKDYVDSDPSGRRGLPITTIKQGAEPPTFAGWFQAWDPKMWETDPLARVFGRVWAPNSWLFLPVWLLIHPALPNAALFILPLVPKCQKPMLSPSLGWVAASAPWCRSSALDLQNWKCTTSVVEWRINRNWWLKVACCIPPLVVLLHVQLIPNRK